MIKFFGIVFISILVTACKPPETYSLVQICEGPFMRRDKEKIMKRDSDGKYFYVDARGVYIPIDSNVDIKKVCR